MSVPSVTGGPAVVAAAAQGAAAATTAAGGPASAVIAGVARQDGADKTSDGRQQGGLPAVSGGLPATQPAAAPALAASAATAPQAAPPPLTEQLARPIFQLATGQAGQRVMTVQVVPQSLGPVTVSAHLGADGLRIELAAATDAGRDGLRLILTELRRDLAGQGVASSLSLSSSLNGGTGGQAQSFGQNGFGQNAFGQNGTAPREPGPGPWGAASGRDRPAAPRQEPLGTPTHPTSLDITV
ncbi:hypothetical protein B5P43_16280 [Bacillus sp. SRB_336]|nr:hypothetical protein B5P43_16280 [Bacillus sp. SRB_336]